MSTPARRLAAPERKRPPPGPPSFREESPDLPPGSEAIVARAVLDSGCAIEAAIGRASLDVIAPAILLLRERVIEVLRAGRPVPGRLVERGAIIDPAAVAERLRAAGCGPGPTPR